MSGIFISYRRDDQAGFAGRLADVLVARFGADQVFRDIEDIAPGQDFVAAIEQHLAAVDVVLVLIGPAWLTLARDGVRRIDEAEDFVRHEIAAGLAAGKAVLPVLVGGAAMPGEADLPPAIRDLARRQAFVLSDAGWASDVVRLVEAVQPLVGSRGMGGRRGWLVGMAAVAVGGGVWFWWTQRTDGRDGAAVAGGWQAEVRYDWGAMHGERFDLRLDGDRLRGTASYLGVPRSIEQGTVQGGRIEFVTHSQEVVGDGSAREVTHRYRGVWTGDALRLTLDSTGGYSSHPPVDILARRAAP